MLTTPEADLGLLQHRSWKPLTIITKRSILDVAAVLDPPLDTSLFSVNFSEHLKKIFQKTNKTIGLLRKLQTLPPLITIYKSFIRPHLGYGDMIYDQTFNMSFQQKMETIQYNAALAITGALRGSSREKLYQELGLEPPQQRRWYREGLV